MTTTLDDMTVELVLDRAREAARREELELAGRLLDELNAKHTSVTALDLRARVHAQRGEFDAADRCWAQVQAQAPEDPSAAAGRRAVEKIRRGGRVRPLVTGERAAVTASLLAVVALLGGGTWLVSSDMSHDSAVANRLQTEQQRANDLRRELDSVRDARAAEAARVGRVLGGIAARLEMPGVLLDRRADHVRVRFEEGVFSRGTTIQSSGSARLAELGARLRGLRADVTVVGHAVAVPGGLTSGGSPVAVRRALEAAEILARTSGRPLTSFALASADQADGPFPDAERNRTVTLLLTPRSAG